MILILVLIKEHKISSNSKPKGYKTINISISKLVEAILGTDNDFFVKTEIFIIIFVFIIAELYEGTLAPHLHICLNCVKQHLLEKPSY